MRVLAARTGAVREVRVTRVRTSHDVRAPRVVLVAVCRTDGARTSGAHLPRTGKHTLRVLAVLLGPVHSHRDNTTGDVAVSPPKTRGEPLKLCV